MTATAIEVLNSEHDGDLRKWDALVDRAPVGDVYYRPGYVLACREAETQSICGLIINAAGFKVLVPTMISQISSEVRYAHSPYGYGGVLPLESSLAPTAKQIQTLRRVLQEWAHGNHLVCMVLRMHPLLCQADWFDSDACEDVVSVKGNETISVDLTVWNEDGKNIASLNKGRRSDLKVARNNLRMTWACGWNQDSREALETFQVIYNDHMRSLGASEFYFFPSSYYLDLARGLGRQLAVGLTWLGSDPAGGALFMADTKYAHYHLSGGNLLGYKYKASTFLVNEGAAWARERGCSQLHLGGGLKHGDSLFQFKQSFGGSLSKYGTVTIVGDRTTFRSLCQMPDAAWPFKMCRQTAWSEITA